MKASEISENFRNKFPDYSKEKLALIVILEKDFFIKVIHEVLPQEEKTAWQRLVFNMLINEVRPFAAEMGIEESSMRVKAGIDKKTDEIDLDYFMKKMMDDIRSVNVLRFFGFITPAQAKKMMRDCWLLGDCTNALVELRLDEEFKEDDLAVVIKAILEKNPRSVADYKAGKLAATNSLLGQVIKQCKAEGKNADPIGIKALIVKFLDEIK